MFRVIFFGLLLIGIYFFIKRMMNPPDFKTCGRCEGKGFWYAPRGKETCDWCKGSGKLPIDDNR